MYQEDRKTNRQEVSQIDDPNASKENRPQGYQDVNETSQNPYSSATSVTSTDDEDDRILIDDGIPAEIPLEALAGPALILPTSSTDLDGKTLTEEFDWAGREDDEDGEKEDNHEGALTKSSVFICLSKNSSWIAWTCIILFALCLLAIDIAVFVVYPHRNEVSLVSYNLQLWFTWLAFMWCISFMSQVAVEVVPWGIKKLVGYLRPHSTEVLRMRLSYYMALRLYIKLVIITAWCWGSWAFISYHVPRPVDGDGNYQALPQYVGVFFSIWEACFFAALFLFIEKFILQLIVTAFHKKAYGDRIKENDKALRILDRLKRMKRKNPQEFLLKRIRKKNKNGGGSNTATPSRSHSLDEGGPDNYFSPQLSNRTTPPLNKSIMSTQGDAKGNVKFPSENMDTLIAIPPIEDRNRSDDDEKDPQLVEDPEINQTEDIGDFTQEKRNSPNFINRFAKRLRHRKSGGHETPQENTPSSTEDALSRTPPPLSRENTWFSRNSHDEKGFLEGARDFGLSTTAIPGKLLKGGYKKFVTQNAPKHQNPNQNTTYQAKILAKKIYNNVKSPDNNRQFILESDFYSFFRTREEADHAFGLFDKDGNGDISKRELRSGCIRIYRERKNLARSMRDLSQATGKLDIILMIIFIVVWAIIVCSAFGVNVGTELMPLWSAFIAASFVFGTSAKDAFEAIIFVFVTLTLSNQHPFDAGDRVFIGGENWVVHNVGLLVTTFLKWDGSIVYAKNSVLTTQYIINCRRTGRTGQTVDLQISFETPSWKVRKITTHMTEWCNLYPKLYTTDATCSNVMSFQNQNMIALSFYFEHTQNWQDAGGRWLRHNKFMMELKEECERLEIGYTLPVQPFEQHKKSDVPPEINNMGEKSSYGQQGLTRRRPYDDDDGDDFKGRPSVGGNAGHAASNNSGDAGASGGSAAAMMFASTIYHYDVKPKVELTPGYPPFITKPSLHDTQVTQDQLLCNEIHEEFKDEKPQSREKKTSPTITKKRRYRRESHNAVERRRRNNINDNIKSLGQLLPENICQGKLNKGTILKGSVIYIHMLNDQLLKYKQRLESLQYEANRLI
ncbi:hypothetical protein K501DRAFT_328372 [Backusella circina FSU 941]|nr:hypothetical protein K501DRAFT_328372 [Backusella circina FSU 941]